MTSESKMHESINHPDSQEVWDYSQALPILERVVVGVPKPDETLEFLTKGLDFDIQNVGGKVFGVTLGNYGQPGQPSLEIHQGEQLNIHNVVFRSPHQFDTEPFVKNFAGSITESGGVQLKDPSGLGVVIEQPENQVWEKPAISEVRPRRLGHVNAKTPNPMESAMFYKRALGMVVSEMIGENLMFMRTATEHHNVGLRPGKTGDIHHMGFELAGWDSYRFVLDHLDDAGYKVEYGPGKHRPGRSFFTYVRDPSSGLRFELFADMVHINTGRLTPPIEWEAGDRMTKTINIWGPTPPESFME